MTKPLTSVSVSLAFPVPVKGEDGKPAERAMLVFARPKARHVKALAVIVGPELARMFLDQDAASADRSETAAELVAALVTGPNLEALTEVLADLAGEQPATIDDLDAMDLIAVGRALLDFFPSLKSSLPAS